MFLLLCITPFMLKRVLLFKLMFQIVQIIYVELKKTSLQKKKDSVMHPLYKVLRYLSYEKSKKTDPKKTR